METLESIYYYGSIFLVTILGICVMSVVCNQEPEEEDASSQLMCACGQYHDVDPYFINMLKETYGLVHMMHDEVPTQSAPRRSARIAARIAWAKVCKEEAQRRARVKAELRARLKRDPDPDSDWNHCVECGEPEHGESAMCDPAVRGGW